MFKLPPHPHQHLKHKRWLGSFYNMWHWRSIFSLKLKIHKRYLITSLTYFSLVLGMWRMETRFSSEYACWWPVCRSKNKKQCGCHFVFVLSQCRKNITRPNTGGHGNNLILAVGWQWWWWWWWRRGGPVKRSIGGDTNDIWYRSLERSVAIGLGKIFNVC